MTRPTLTRAGLLRALLAGLLLALAACGGGVEIGGTGTGAYVQGPISGFGSIIVAGVRFDDSAASIEDPDGVVRQRQDLRLGMLVEVDSGPIVDDGSGRAATATRVRVAGKLVGPLSQLDVAGSRLVVLGQPVRLTAATVVDGVVGGVASLQLGSVLEVHGFYAPDEGYVATRVERRTAQGMTFRVRGQVRDLDANARTLRIGSQGFDLGATGAPAGLANGQFVRLTLQPVQVAGRWPVVAVEVETPAVSDRDDVEVEGLISAFTSAAAFSLNGVRVDAAAANFVDGIEGLRVGARVRVRGRSQQGVLVASAVDIRSDDDAFREGVDIREVIGSVDAAAQTFRLRGVTVVYANSPRFDNGTAADLAPGRRVRVRGTVSADRTRVVATRIEFVD